MNPAEDCLRYLRSKNWDALFDVLNNNKSASYLAESPAFSTFEDGLIWELGLNKTETDKDFLFLAEIMFQKHQNKNSVFRLSENAFQKLTKYLFDKNPKSTYANLLPNDQGAQQFLKEQNIDRQNKIDATRIRASLDIKVGLHGELQFDKVVFNSPQEIELYLAARTALPDRILLPNAALSTIIDSKVCDSLDKRMTTFFYKSTLDLCTVNPLTYRPELFIELDSSWHDKPRNSENDKMKDKIFEEAGLRLHRLRKKEHKEMIEIFKLFISEIYKNYQSE